ncbi:MAG: hypothetical protein K9L17_02770 [Clostridiales bacterium]|nr:hypothetical protein [Clostridiales bacterium]MCF8021603.1 hypothetical protein [Clostridiales bacterium]
MIKLKLNQSIFILIVGFISLFLVLSFASEARASQMDSVNQNMYKLYNSGNKQEAFNIYKKTLQEQAKISTGYDVNLFPSTAAEYKAFQNELKKQSLEKSLEEIKVYAKKSEKLHREIFTAMMTKDPDKMGAASQRLTKLSQNFFARGSSSAAKNTSNSNSNQEIYDGSIGDEANKVVNTLGTFINSWSDYVSERDSKGNLKAFSDIYINTPESLIINENDGVVMSSFKVLGKGGYYLFLKARLWIAEGYGEIGGLLGKATGKYLD